MSDHVQDYVIFTYLHFEEQVGPNPLDLSRSIISMVYVADVPIG